MQKTGKYWEQVAEKFLSRQSLTLISRNYSCRLGEIDLIMKDKHIICFIEVRYRQRNDHGSAIDSISWHKRRKVIRASGIFLSQHPRLAEQSCRYDVIAISGGWRYKIDWIKNAFDIND